MPKPGQLTALDPADPNSYETSVYWPEPLPVDILVKLNEISQKMALGVESKRGALADLGEEFPDEKLAEIFAEILEDAKDQGALQLQTSAIQSAIVALTGMVPAGGEVADSGQESGGGCIPVAGRWGHRSDARPDARRKHDEHDERTDDPRLHAAHGAVPQPLQPNDAR